MSAEHLPTITEHRSLELDYRDPEIIKTIRETICPGATDSEFKMFRMYCESTALNPFKREIWFIKIPGYTRKDGKVVPPRVQIMTGINGFYAIANSHPQYDGIEKVEYVMQGPQLISAEVRAWRRDRKFPSVGTPYFAEYNKGEGNWNTMPRMMLGKVAESIALRKLFPQQLGGMYTEEEMPREYARPGEGDTLATVAEVSDCGKPVDKSADNSTNGSNHLYNPTTPYFYRFADGLSAEQTDAVLGYLEKNSAVWNEEKAAWMTSAPLKTKSKSLICVNG